MNASRTADSRTADSRTADSRTADRDRFGLSLAAITAIALTAGIPGCVVGSDPPLDDAAAEAGNGAAADDADSKDPGEAADGAPRAAIEQPVFYEADEDGVVIAGPIPDEIDESTGFKSAGTRPIHVQKYGPFGNGGTLSTGFPTSDWVATVVGIDTTDGDINENGVGNPLRAFPFQSNGIWHVTFDLRSHFDNESWSVWVMYIQRDLATTTNF